ncbi:MAG: hypothetical protein IJ729_00270 [Alloprevotella sp.]|nr:hypothetical protein [Alloprevotella sp.]
MVSVPVLISGLSLAVAVIVAITNLRRNNAADDRRAATETTTLIVKLENINNGVNEIKSDMRSMKSDIQDLRDRLIIVEQSAKSAHHRIDTLEGIRKDDIHDD